MKDWLCSVRLSDVGPHVEEVAELIKKVSTSEFPEIQSLTGALLEEGLNYIVWDSDSDWDNLQASRDAFAELGDLAHATAFEHIDQKLSELTQEALDRFAESGDYYNQERLEQMVELAGSHHQAEEYFPGLSEARSFIEGRKDMMVGSGARLPDVAARREDQRVDTQVHEVMSMLRQPGSELAQASPGACGRAPSRQKVSPVSPLSLILCPCVPV